MSSQVRYIFGDLRTNEVIEEISCTGVSMSDSLEGGEFRASFALDQTGKNNEDLVAATIPGKCFVVAERNGVPIWGGLIWSATYQSQAKVFQLYAKTMDQYPTKRLITEDVSFTAIEQRNIFRELWLDMMADPHSPQFTVPAAFSNLVAQDFGVPGSELHNYREAFDNLTTTENGFEWRINVTKEDGSYNWSLQIGYPVIGQPYNDNSVIFEYPGNILNYWRNDTIGGSGTNIFGIGAGEGQVMPVVEVVHQDLLDAGFPRLDHAIPMKDIEDVDRLESLTQMQAAVRKAPMPVYTVEMKADRDPQFTDWVLGDYCGLVIKDPRHPQGVTQPARILKWDYTPQSSEAAEEVRLTFEGEEAE